LVLHVADDRRRELTGQTRDFARRLLKLLASLLEVVLKRRLIALLLLLLFLRLLLSLLLLLLSLLLGLLLLFLGLLLRFLVLRLLVVGLADGRGARKTEHERRQAENLDSVSHRRRSSRHVLRPHRRSSYVRSQS
jgi:hypothetical protein